MIQTQFGALTNLAKLLADQGRKVEAATFWERAASVDPKSCRIWGNLASVYRDLNREADAKRGFEQALQILNTELAVDRANENSSATVLIS